MCQCNHPHPVHITGTAITPTWYTQAVHNARRSQSRQTISTLKWREDNVTIWNKFKHDTQGPVRQHDGELIAEAVATAMDAIARHGLLRATACVSDQPWLVSPCSRSCSAGALGGVSRGMESI